MDKLITELNIGTYEEVVFHSGHNACPSCGSTIAVRQVLNAIGEGAVYFVPASCASLYFSPNDTAAAAVPVVHTVFAAAFAEAEGFVYGLRRQGRQEKVVVWAGDGACYDIGLSGLSGIAARNADLIVFCNDNQGYQNTGGHESSATPPETVSHGGNGNHTEGIMTGVSKRKDLAEIMVAHGAPYVATASAAFPDDLADKVKKAAKVRGFRFILLLTSCVTWRYDSRYSVKLARLAVETGYWPLYEVEHGRYRITYQPPFTPFEEFAKLQGRFRDADLDSITRQMQDKWEDLRFKASRFEGSGFRVQGSGG